MTGKFIATRITQVVLTTAILLLVSVCQIYAQGHPRIYTTNEQKQDLLKRIKNSGKVSGFIDELKAKLDPYVIRHQNNPEWIVSRLQMYWKTKYSKVYVNGMDFSHGEGTAPVPTVRFSGSRDWDTDYLRPKLEDVKPYMDDERGLYLQNGKKEGKPWEWIKPSETGNIIEGINREILDLAEDAAFLYWLSGEKKYAVFASDIFMKYIEGMYYREPPLTFKNHGNANLMGLQTFEVIHEGIIEPITICYDFLFSFLKDNGSNLKMIQDVFRKWADQEIKFGVPDNNWNLMQARFITYLGTALENDSFYEDGKGQQYYFDQVLNQNSIRQKALRDVVKNYDQQTGVWPEVAGYNMLVSNDILEIYCLMDKTLNNNLLAQYPIVEKANLAIFQYLFPNGFTVAYGDAKHSRIRFNSLELLIAQYRKYGNQEKESMITKQLKRFIEDGAYTREKSRSLFQLFFYVEDLMDVPPAASFSGLTNPMFYAPNVSWVVQRNGNSMQNGMMISENASLGNHSHTNGVNIELFAKGMVIAPDCAAGVSYWSDDHKEYYSRFAAHNTVVVDGISDYQNMRGTHAFKLNSIYPSTESVYPLTSNCTISDVTFHEPSSDATQHRVIGTVRTSETSGYFVDIFRSARINGKDKKHEYLFHGQGEPIRLRDFKGKTISTLESDELSVAKGDLVGYNYFKNKRSVKTGSNFIAQFEMPSILGGTLNLNFWMKGFDEREIFTVEAPYSKAVNEESVSKSLYHKSLPTLVVRQKGEARTRPFVAIIDAFNQSEGESVKNVQYFNAINVNPGFIGIMVYSKSNRHDMIFNDENPESKNQFKNGAFIGSYGVISTKDRELIAILLHHGTEIAHESFKIEIPANYGDVLIRKNKEGFEIEATHPFIFTVPVDKNSKKLIELKLVDEKGKKSYTGKVSGTDKLKVAVFELPAFSHVQLNY